MGGKGEGDGILGIGLGLGWKLVGNLGVGFFGRDDVDFFIANLILWGRVKHVLNWEDWNFRRWLA